MTDQRKTWLQHLVTALITSIAVLAGSWFTFVGEHDKANAARLDACFQRVEYLEKRIDELEEKIFLIEQEQ